jgi:hypothetical protein
VCQLSIYNDSETAISAYPAHYTNFQKSPGIFYTASEDTLDISLYFSSRRWHASCNDYRRYGIHSTSRPCDSPV